MHTYMDLYVYVGVRTNTQGAVGVCLEKYRHTPTVHTQSIGVYMIYHSIFGS